MNGQQLIINDFGGEKRVTIPNVIAKRLEREVVSESKVKFA